MIRWICILCVSIHAMNCLHRWRHILSFSQCDAAKDHRNIVNFLPPATIDPHRVQPRFIFQQYGWKIHIFPVNIQCTPRTRLHRVCNRCRLHSIYAEWKWERENKNVRKRARTPSIIPRLNIFQWLICSESKSETGHREKWKNEANKLQTTIFYCLHFERV